MAPVPGEEVEVPLDIDADPRLQAAVDYLTPIFNLMGVENFTFTAVKKGAATVLKVSGEHMGALIGRRGETMESLSYLASLVVNRMEALTSSWAWMSAATATSARTTSLPLPGALQTASSARAATMRWSR